MRISFKKIQTIFMSWETRKNYLFSCVLFTFMFIVASIVSPYFLTYKNISQLLIQMVTLGFVAMGQAYVLVSGGIDLSVGSLVSMTTLIIALSPGVDPARLIIGFLLAIIAAVIVGILNYFSRMILGIDPFIGTLASMSIVQGLAYTISIGTAGTAPKHLLMIYNGKLGPIPVVVIIFGLVAFIAAIILEKTKTGLRIYAVGQSRQTASYSGLNTRQIILLVHIIAGMLICLGGVFLTPRISAGSPIVGSVFLLDSIAAVVLGGTPLTGGRGSITGTIAGTAIMSLINNFLNMLGVTIYWKFVAKGAILLAVVAGGSFMSGSITKKKI